MSLADTFMGFKIAKLLEMLNDGKWHKLDEIQQRMKLKENDVQQIAQFLKEYNLVIVKETKKAIKLEENARRFFSSNSSS
jgi:transcription initiation factor IIE alpha subunit